MRDGALLDRAEPPSPRPPSCAASLLALALSGLTLTRTRRSWPPAAVLLQTMSTRMRSLWPKRERASTVCASSISTDLPSVCAMCNRTLSGCTPAVGRGTRMWLVRGGRKSHDKFASRSVRIPKTAALSRSNVHDVLRQTSWRQNPRGSGSPAKPAQEWVGAGFSME